MLVYNVRKKLQGEERGGRRMGDGRGRRGEMEGTYSNKFHSLVPPSIASH